MHADWLALPFQFKLALFQIPKVHTGSGIGRMANQRFTRSGGGREAGGDVDGIAQGGEIGNRAFYSADRAYEGYTRMHPHPDREPGTVRCAVTGSMQQIPGSLYGQARVIRSGPTRKIQANHFIADQLVNERVCFDHDIRGHSVKPIHQLAEIGGAHAFRQRGRTAHVHEEEREFNFRTARVPLRVFNSQFAETRAFVRGPLAN